MGWEPGYEVSLRHPNKRHSISKEGCSIRVQDYLKNVWNVRHYFITKFGVDQPIINGDQMPLYRNESSGQATLSFKNHEAFVKENHHLSKERVTVFTQIATNENIQPVSEFVFKGTGKRPPKLTSPSGTHYQWADKGSIKHLPDRFNIFSHDSFAICVLDDYAVHLMPEERQALWNRGYILIIIGGGITCFVQVNSPHLHKPLKSEYRKKESKLMLEKLQSDPQKVPALDRNEVMRLFVDSNKDLKIDVKSAFKSVWVINALDGSKDYLVSDKIFGLDGESITSFRTEMNAKPPPKVIKELIN